MQEAIKHKIQKSRLPPPLNENSATFSKKYFQQRERKQKSTQITSTEIIPSYKNNNAITNKQRRAEVECNRTFCAVTILKDQSRGRVFFQIPYLPYFRAEMLYLKAIFMQSLLRYLYW